MYGLLLEPSDGEQVAELGELARVLSKTMNLPVYNKVPIDLNVKVVESKGKTVPIKINEYNIWSGSGQNADLSNLALRPFQDKEGRGYQTVEHAYQTLKSGTFDA